MSEWSFPEAEFLGTRLSLVRPGEVLAAVDQAVACRRPLLHASLNAAKVVAAARDPGFRDLLGRFDLLTADGMSVVWGARLLGLPPVERLAGVDLLQRLLAHARERGQRVYFLGATDAVLAALAGRVAARHPGLQVAGARNGYFPPQQDARVAAEVAESGADLLFVGMPSPRKERFLMENRQRLNVPFAMGVGGSFDVLAGKVRRAPRLLQRSGLEWAFRLMQEPRRLAGRYLACNSRFLLLLLRARLNRHAASRA